MHEIQQKTIIGTPNEAHNCKLDAVLVMGEDELERIVIAINGKIIDIDMQGDSATVERRLGDTYRLNHIRKAKVAAHG